MKEENKRIWAELKEYDERMYRHARCGLLGIGTNLPTKAGEKTSIALYRVANRIFKFN